MRVGFISFLITVGAALSAQAGAWVQPQGQWLFITQATYYATNRYYDTNGKIQTQARYQKNELQPYVEYGLSEALTVGGSGYMQSVSQSGKNNIGVADSELFVRARLWHDDRRSIAIQPLVKLPSYFAKTNTPRGGSRTVDAELSALYGQNLTLLSQHDYVDVRLGYRQRNRGLSSQVRGDVALGLAITPDIVLVPALRGVMATDPTDSAIFTEGADLDYSVLKAELNSIYTLNKTQWLQAGIFSHAIGTQTGRGYGASLGFAQRF